MYSSAAAQFETTRSYPYPQAPRHWKSESAGPRALTRRERHQLRRLSCLCDALSLIDMREGGPAVTRRS